MANAVNISYPQLGTLAATRGLIGLGAGLLLANVVPRDKRKLIGLPLFIGGVLSTIPIAMRIFHGSDSADESLKADQPAA
jgi:hypothetical protein